ncbi:glycosyltransferase [Flavimarina sp. Hel_I_48]|uniref:glycosyltransferase n=1 Tax=Flavimarina sp. Hel_I_48 TaxID=1392488 RepID=UPI0004DF7F4E|nr:glycosyltransferase [Flavimarina sp. Hel_I_48]
MIFVTIGTQEPFDRLIKAVDEIAYLIPDEDFFVQGFLKDYKPKYFKTVDFINPKEFNFQFEKADLIIAHAGMGTVISALLKSKPLVIMPRLLKYSEHRNEHQLATAEKLKTLNYVHVADNEKMLKDIVLESFKKKLIPLYQIGDYASKSLLLSIEQFIDS